MTQPHTIAFPLGSSLLVPRFIALSGALAGASLFAACSVGGGGGSSTFSIRRTDVSVAGSTPVAIVGKNLAFLADEATTGDPVAMTASTDMNGDGDMIDSIAYVVNMSTNVQTNLGVAATDVAWIGDELYLAVDESLDGRDWNADADMTDLVLLHWSAAAPTLTFVDRLAAAGTRKMLAIGTNLFYSSARAPTLAMESNLQAISSSAPLTPIPIGTQDAGGPLSPILIGKDEGLVFLALDETAEARDLDGDADMLDTAVLALLDGTDNTTVIRSTNRAMRTVGSPLRARRTSSSSHDWNVGFLVSEADQGATNLNSPALFGATWKPTQCVGFEDVDATDEILFFLNFLAWDTNPVTDPPVNTGLVGSRKIAIVSASPDPYIATITPEFGALDPAGAEGTCDLNGDGDTLDHVVRWVAMSTPVLPLTPPENIHALSDPPGGTHGLSELQSRFVIEVSESEDNLDINGDAMKTLDLVGWLSPSGSATSLTPWDFTHGSGNTTFVGASWMAEQRDRLRLDVALEEKVEGLNINAHIPPVAGEDTDTLDSVPTFADFTGSTVHLAFPGVAIAVKKDDAGIVIARNFAFYRVSEAEDSRNWNPGADTDETDFILFRTSLIQGVSGAMGVLNAIPGRPAIDVNLEESPQGAAFIADEQLQGASGTDFNGDGNKTDLVISYFRF